MLKTTALCATISLLCACSSSQNASIGYDYEQDVVTQTTEQEGYTEIVGKAIIPVDLLELNLSLQVSSLAVIAKVDADAEMPNSDVLIQLEYTHVKKQEEEEVEREYDTAMVDGVAVALVDNEVSRQCGDTDCVVSQSFTFPVATTLLQNATQDGVAFSLLAASQDELLTLETMIPGRYLTALFAAQ